MNGKPLQSACIRGDIKLIKINDTSLNYHFKRLFLGPKNYKLAASRSSILHPVSQKITRAAIFKESDLLKIKQVQKETTFGHEYSRINGGKIRLAATTAYFLENVVAADGNIYKSNMKYPLRTYRDKVIIDEEHQNYSSACLVSSYMGCKYFGHWMRDDLPKYLAALDIDTPISCLKNKTAHQISYENVLDVKPIFYCSGAIKKLTILEDYSQNAYKVRRYRKFRETISHNYKKSTKRGVMILRGGDGSERKINNEHEVAEYLSGIGFDILDITCSSVDEIIKKCRVDIVIGVEGSHLGNCLYSINEGGCIITIQPPYRFNNVYKDYADCMDMNYAFLVANESECHGLSVDIGDLDEILNQVQNSIYRRHL